ncbi:MAG: hypothetical protein ACKO7P_14790 [Bacteroidota bacterium]
MKYSSRILLLFVLFFSRLTLAQNEKFIHEQVGKQLTKSRSESGYIKFNSDDKLNKATDFYLENIISNDKATDLKELSKKFGINVFKLNVYPVRYLNDEIWKEQLQYIVDEEKFNNSSLTSPNDFYRNVAVRKNKYSEYLVLVCYGTYLDVACWSK